ncbi:MAG: NADH-quinone oxidoreductase subunit N [Elusimicrobiota bacterium]|jgi:NADH-quinone oxidoreductase subunit N
MNALADPTLSLLLPQAACALGLVLVLLLGMRPGGRDGFALERWVAALAAAAGLLLVLRVPSGGETELFRADGMSKAWQILFHLGTLALFAVLRPRGERPLALALAALLGMDTIASANHLFALFLGLELTSLPTYLLVAGLRPGRRSLEAALKYFFAGAAASALFLMGLALQYAATGSFSFAGGLPGAASGLALALMGSAALFKIGAFPFHFWLPDVYEAAEPELTAWMSTAVKAAGVLILLRILGGHADFDLPDLSRWLPAVAVATMTFANLIALRQSDVRRLLAYSSVSHVGYLTAAVWAWQTGGMPGDALATVYFYLFAYLFMNTGAFLFLRLCGIRELEELRGFGSRAPLLAGVFALMVFSLAALPPTTGFLAKFFVVWDLLKAGGTGLAVAVVVNSLVGAGYYLNLIRLMTLEPAGPRTAPAPGRTAPAAALVLLACAAFTAGFGLVPGLREWLAAFLIL